MFKYDILETQQALNKNHISKPGTKYIWLAAMA